jgi:hypothetical protein
MNRFVRLISIIVIAGFAVSATVVVVANAWSRQQQAKRNVDNRERFSEIVAEATDHQRRLDMVVESQELDARGQALESTVLARQYASTGSDQSRPLKVVRIVIPSDLVVVEGVIFDFSEDFAADAWQYQLMRKNNLSYFSLIRGKDQMAPKLPARDPRFTYLPRSNVPEMTRIEPLALRPSSFEVGFWNYVWDLVPEPVPASLEASRRGLKVKWVASEPMRLQRERTYTAYIGTSGISIQENAIPTLPGLLDSMLAERKRMDELPSQ